MLSRAKRGVVLLADKDILEAFCRDPEHKKRLELVTDFLSISTSDFEKADWTVARTSAAAHAMP